MARGSLVYRALYWALRVGLKAIASTVRAIHPSQTNRILVYFGDTRALGDLLMRNCAILQTRLRYPDAEIDILLPEGLPESAESLFRYHSWADRVETHPPRLAARAMPGWFRVTAKILLRQHRLCVIDTKFYGGIVGPSLLAACGIPRIIGRAVSPEEERHLTETLHVSPDAHWVDVVTEYARLLGLDVGAGVAIRLAGRRSPFAGETCRHPRVVVHVGGSTVWHRSWPLDRYRIICQRLCEEIDASVFLVGTQPEAPDNRWVRDQVVAHWPCAEITDLTGASLSQVISCMDAADLFIGNDSGPMHLAAILGRPVIAIFGPSDPRRWGPQPVNRDSLHVVGSLDCQPCETSVLMTGIGCLRGPDEQYQCLTAVSVDDVWSVVLDRLTLLVGP